MAGKHAHKWYIYTDDHTLVSEDDQIDMYLYGIRGNSTAEWFAAQSPEELREQALQYIAYREEDFGLVSAIEVPDDYPMDRLRSGEYYDHNYVSV